MSFYYDNFSRKSNQAKVHAKPAFFSHALSVQRQADLPGPTHDTRKTLSRETAKNFVQKARDKIHETRSSLHTVDALSHQLQQLLDGAQKYTEIRQHNFLKPERLQPILADLKHVFVFLETRVYKYKVERFTSDFWVGVLEKTAALVDRFFRVLEAAFGQPTSTKLSLSSWMDEQKAPKELLKLLETVFHLASEFVERIQKHQEAKPGARTRLCFSAILDFCEVLAGDLETLKLPKKGFLGFHLSSSKDFLRPLAALSVQFVSRTLEILSRAPLTLPESTILNRVGRRLFLFSVAHFGEISDEKEVIKLAKAAFLRGELEMHFAEITSRPEFTLAAFLQPFHKLLTKVDQSIEHVGLFSVLIFFVAWVYKHKAYLVTKFSFKMPTADASDEREAVFAQLWVSHLVSDDSSLFKHLTDNFGEAFYEDLMTQTPLFLDVKQFLRRQFLRFWYGLHLMRDSHYKVNLLNQLSKSKSFYRLLETQTTFGGSTDAQSLVGRELNVVLLASLLNFDQMIFQPEEILASFAHPKVFFAQLADVIVAEIFFKRDYYYSRNSIEKFQAKQIAAILGFVHGAQSELGIPLPVLWPGNIPTNTSHEFLQDFFFFFDVKARFDVFKRSVTDFRNFGDMDEGYGGSYQVTVSRSNLVEDGVRVLSKVLNNEHLARAHIRVAFIDEFGNYEEGNDHGGLFKDLLTEMMRTLFNPAYGLTVELEATRELYINHSSGVLFGQSGEEVFKVMGFLLGKSLQMGITLDVKLAQIFLRKLKLQPIHLQELRLYDPELFHRLRALKSDPNVGQLDLTFTTSGGEFSSADVELVPGGAQIPVTPHNVIKFVYYLANYKLNEQVRRQFGSFLEGFRTVIEPQLLRIFSSAELQTIIYGTEDEISVQDLAVNTRYENGFSATDYYIRDFWEVVSGLTPAQKKQLLKFVTNIDRPPIFGFQNLNPKFCLYQVKGDNLNELPRAATCGNVLFLHQYPNKNVLREKLVAAITMASGHYQH